MGTIAEHDKRLSKVEANQILLSDKMDSISASLELITSGLIPDVKKGERIPKDKCKDTKTLTKDDDRDVDGNREHRSKADQDLEKLLLYILQGLVEIILQVPKVLHKLKLWSLFKIHRLMQSWLQSCFWKSLVPMLQYLIYKQLSKS